MKRLLLTLLTVFYLGTSSGAVVHLHYCMGELVNLSLTKSEQSTCGLCGMTKTESSKNSCCKDDSKQAKLDQSKKTNQLVYSFKQFPATVISSFKSDVYHLALLTQQVKTVYGNAPPERLSVPVFIRNCTYRI